MSNIHVYVKVKDVRSSLHLLDETKQLLVDAKRLLHDLHDLRVEENAQLYYIKRHLKELTHRIDQFEKDVAI